MFSPKIAGSFGKHIFFPFFFFCVCVCVGQVSALGDGFFQTDAKKFFIRKNSFLGKYKKVLVGQFYFLDRPGE